MKDKGDLIHTEGSHSKEDPNEYLTERNVFFLNNMEHPCELCDTRTYNQHGGLKKKTASTLASSVLWPFGWRAKEVS